MHMVTEPRMRYKRIVCRDAYIFMSFPGYATLSVCQSAAKQNSHVLNADVMKDTTAAAATAIYT